MTAFFVGLLLGFGAATTLALLLGARTTAPAKEVENNDDTSELELEIKNRRAPGTGRARLRRVFSSAPGEDTKSPAMRDDGATEDPEH